MLHNPGIGGIHKEILDNTLKTGGGNSNAGNSI